VQLFTVGQPNPRQVADGGSAVIVHGPGNEQIGALNDGHYKAAIRWGSSRPSRTS